MNKRIIIGFDFEGCGCLSEQVTPDEIEKIFELRFSIRTMRITQRDMCLVSHSIDNHDEKEYRLPIVEEVS